MFLGSLGCTGTGFVLQHYFGTADLVWLQSMLCIQRLHALRPGKGPVQAARPTTGGKLRGSMCRDKMFAVIHIGGQSVRFKVVVKATAS